MGERRGCGVTRYAGVADAEASWAPVISVKDEWSDSDAADAGEQGSKLCRAGPCYLTAEGLMN